MATVVTVVNKGVRFWLKATTWSFSLDRADRFETVELARAAIVRASRFNNAKLMRRVELWDEAMALKEVTS